MIRLREWVGGEKQQVGTGSITGFQKTGEYIRRTLQASKGEIKLELVVSFHFVHSISNKHLKNCDVTFCFNLQSHSKWCAYFFLFFIR